MYWPIGAPRIYAASSSKAASHRVVESDDDAESRGATEGSGSLLEAPSTLSEGLSDDGLELPSGPSTPLSPAAPGVKPTEQSDNRRSHSAPLLENPSPLPDTTPEPADKESVLGLAISRTGHLFAVLTLTSLKIWQTKVHISPCDYDRSNLI
jgi:hypothetical protein